MRFIVAFIAVCALITPIGSPAIAHCEIPCGIYDDEARIELIAEHITTIEKSMNQIMDLSKESPLNHNQIVRWVQNKENHANELQRIVTQYFMTQRLKPADEKDQKACSSYIKKLTLLHHMLVFAMKAKQTTDLEHVKKLRSLLGEFRTEHFDQHVH